MIETILLGVGLLLILMGWRFALHPAMLVNTRDKLFDLRDSIRAEFLSNGRGLEDPAYLGLRALLNGYLRYTEDVTFFRVVGVIVLQNEHREAYAGVHAETERRLRTESDEINQFVLKVRRKALIYVFDYAVKTSLVGSVLSLVGVCWIAITRCKELCVRLLSGTNGFQKGALLHALAYGVLVIFSAQPMVKSRDIAQAAMEEQALHCMESI